MQPVVIFVVAIPVTVESQDLAGALVDMYDIRRAAIFFRVRIFVEMIEVRHLVHIAKTIGVEPIRNLTLDFLCRHLRARLVDHPRRTEVVYIPIKLAGNAILKAIFSYLLPMSD